ncbi:MAG: helix-turn-helix transcriptional regulator [Clostridia bacterium]|nr:helix-turn-helix transcriptional regulator [Clostridia bacterium]
MQIGNKIRELRKMRGITQEQLAERIGISFQAVSKWENNITMPDITHAPVLARIFGVSMDELFDYDATETAREIADIADAAYKCMLKNPLESKRILMEGLKKYPDHEILLGDLLYFLDYSENPDESIAVASKLIEKTDQSNIKYDALRFLAYAYKAKGDMESAAAAIEQIPEMCFTKLTEKARILSGKPKLEAAEKQKQLSSANLLLMMREIADYYESCGNAAEALTEAEKALNLMSIIGDPDFDGIAASFRRQTERLRNSV